MSLSADCPATRVSIQLLLFVNSRSATLELAEQIRLHLHHLQEAYPVELEVVELGERPYLAEHYKLVAMPALVKISPLPAQVLAGGDLTTQIEVWWPRWQGQAALMTQQNQSESQPDRQPSQPSAAFLQLSEEVFQLRQEQSQLQEQLAFKDRILAMLVHDLRSPLTATSIAIESLQQGEMATLDPATTQHLLEQARQQIRKMDSMITDILEAAHGTTAELKITSSEVQLGELCWSVIQDFMPRIRRQQLTLQTDIPTDLPTVHVDCDKIRQVLANLLDNAIKYNTPQGKIHLYVLHRTAQKVQVTVSDTGPGIPEPDQERIFSDQFRLVRDQQQEGYGIGLSLCRRIIRAHYGQIWVDSRLGQGSSFHFTLPVFRT
ncbi:MAG: histidine kinase [Cyanobacteriota bacterium]|nr:histidine kinase [Cyanobacteriota bacterium]